MLANLMRLKGRLIQLILTIVYPPDVRWFSDTTRWHRGGRQPLFVRLVPLHPRALAPTTARAALPPSRALTRVAQAGASSAPGMLTRCLSYTLLFQIKKLASGNLAGSCVWSPESPRRRHKRLPTLN